MGASPEGQEERVYFHHNQQHSAIALSNASGDVIERYSYTSYGELAIHSGDCLLARPASIVGNACTFTGRSFDEETGLYYYRFRMYDPRLGRFISRDPAGYIAGANLYTYCRNSPLNYIDPLGLVACRCSCEDGMTDLKDVINEHINQLLESSKGDATKFWRDVVRGIPPLTGMENWLYDKHRDKMTGVKHGLLARSISAPCMALCGQCVGTDKIGHFFEEGYMYHDISKTKKDKKYATGWGEWMEGKIPTDPDVLKWIKEQDEFVIIGCGGRTNPLCLYDMFGKHGDVFDENSVGNADLEANKAGMEFWNTFFPDGGGDHAEKFDICKYVTEKWDEKKNPNTPQEDKPPRKAVP